jgi:hypothetical protein
VSDEGMREVDEQGLTPCHLRGGLEVKRVFEQGILELYLQSRRDEGDLSALEPVPAGNQYT